MSHFWDLMYLFKKTPWDTGVTPPEIVAMIEGGKVSIGRALDLGCGTGTNAIYLAQKGFEVTGLDISGRAILVAKRKARSAQLTDRVRLERGDVTLMRRWATGHSIDFAFDIGCFHNLAPEARARYVAALTVVLKPDAIYMLYAFEPGSDGRGVGLDEIAKLFDHDYKLEGLRHGGDSHRGDRNSRKSAWYTFKRREE